MSQQQEDPFIWKGEEWVFMGADDVYKLFDPEEYGLHPEELDTGCYKGFVISFKMEGDRLLLHNLVVNTEDDIYPDINGVSAVLVPEYTRKGGVKRYNRFGGYHEYKDIDLELNYTGTMIVGKDFKKSYSGCAFTLPFAYKTSYDLKFRDGRLVEEKNTSGTYKGLLG